MPMPLRLPEIRPLPDPQEATQTYNAVICHMQDVTEEARLNRVAGNKDRKYSRPRGSSFGLDDFLNDTSGRPGGSKCGRQARTARPSRPAIDDETSVPVEVFESMLRAGKEARGRANHTMAYSQTDGKPYLKHHNAVAAASLPCPMEEVAEEFPVAAPAQPLAVPPRTTSCASEFAGERWQTSHEAVAMQVS